MTFDHARHAGKGLRFAPKGCHSSPGLKAWGFLAWLIKETIREYIKEFIKNLFDPPKKSGFTTVVVNYSRIMYHSYSENKATVIQDGLLQVRAYQEDGRSGVKIFVFDHSTGTLDEIGFSKSHQG
jgi:hypothetical protein